jgi:hypothetical protein
MNKSRDIKLIKMEIIENNSGKIQKYNINGKEKLKKINNILENKYNLNKEND